MAAIALTLVLLRPMLVQRHAGLAAQSGTLDPRVAPLRLDRGRFTAVYYPQDARLAGALLSDAIARDTFPGLPRPKEHVLLAIAPDHRTFRAWVGPDAPEWGAAITFPDERRVVMEGRSAGNTDGDPRDVLRHELAHLALHEALGDLPPRWFDEGYASYAAREWRREDALEANVALALRGTPTFDELDEDLSAGSNAAQNGYAFAYLAVADLAALDPAHGLSRFFAAWRADASLDLALRQTYGITLDDYEHRWRADTHRRYGLLAITSDLAITGLILLLLVLPLYAARRQRDRVRLEAMRAADSAAEQAGSRAAIEALLAGDGPADFGDEQADDAPL